MRGITPWASWRWILHPKEALPKTLPGEPNSLLKHRGPLGGEFTSYRDPPIGLTLHLIGALIPLMCCQIACFDINEHTSPAGSYSYLQTWLWEQSEMPGGGGAIQYQMDTDVRLTLPKAGAFGENTISKNEGPLGEKPNFGSKLGGIGWEYYFWSFSERFKSRNLKKKKSSKMAKMINLSMKLKQKVSSCGSRMQKIGGLWVRAIEEPKFHPKMWGLWVTAKTISKNMGSLGDSSTEIRGSLEPYICITSIMGVPPPNHPWWRSLLLLLGMLLVRCSV